MVPAWHTRELLTSRRVRTPAESPDPIALAVIAELHRRRWTIQTVARLSGVHRCVLSRWLAGRRSIRVADAAVVMRVLGLTVTRSPQ